MRLSRLTWATLDQRVFDIDPLECSSCGGRMRFVEVIEDIGRARTELRRRNLPDKPPPCLERALQTGRMGSPGSPLPSVLAADRAAGVDRCALDSVSVAPSVAPWRRGVLRRLKVM